MSLVPPSINTCPGQTVMFNCTANAVPIIWSVFTPNINYTNLEISNIQVHRESLDGVIMADLIVSRCVNNAYNSSVFLDSKCHS